MVKALRYYSDGPGIGSRWCHWIFQWHIFFRPYHGPGVDSDPSENEYQEHSWEQRRPVREADDLIIIMCRISWKSVSLNFLEPSGPHQACYGTPIGKMWRGLETKKYLKNKKNLYWFNVTTVRKFVSSHRMQNTFLSHYKLYQHQQMYNSMYFVFCYSFAPKGSNSDQK